jgi:zinc transport system substrate-binding protein
MKRLFAPRLFALALVALLTLTLAACGTGNPPSDPGAVDNDKISIIATTFAPYDFTRALTSDRADITMLLPPATESHSFEPTPQDIIKIQNCDVFIYVGGESDEWIAGILDSLNTSKMKVITLMDCVTVVEEEIIEGMEDEEAEGEAGTAEEPEYDEHVWTSPRNAALIVQKLSATFQQADPTNADFYGQNEAAYLTALTELDNSFQAVVDNATRRTIVFGDRFPFRYFTDAYGLSYFAAFPGCSTETEASAATVKFLIDKINEEQIPVIFHIELSNEKMAQTIAEATGAEILQLHACHNVTKSDFDNGETYLTLMAKNADNLRIALQ